MSLSGAAKKRRKEERAGNGKKPGYRVPKFSEGTASPSRKRKPRNGGKGFIERAQG